jgi:hypothetical protein
MDENIWSDTAKTFKEFADALFKFAEVVDQFSADNFKKNDKEAISINRNNF